MRGKLVCLAVAGLLLTLLVVGVALVGQHQMATAEETESTISSAQRFHQDADMQHDTLRHVVLAGVLTANGATFEPAAKVRRDLTDATTRFRADLAGLDRLPMPKTLESAISEIRPAQEAYISQARRLVALIFTDLPRARSLVPSFDTAFNRLAVSQDDVTSLMAATAARAAADSGTARSRAQVAMLVVAAAALLILAALSVLIGRSIVVSLRRLGAVARARGQGDTTARAHEGHDEIGELGAEFNGMADAVDTLHEQLVAHAESLDARVRERTEQLSTANVELVSARKLALEAARLKSEFLATMSHEIRTPMNGVIRLTSLLLETRLDETQSQYAEGVQGAGEALLAVINDILDFSKLEAGKVELELDEFDPRRLVEEVASLLALTAHGKQLELVAYCRPDVPARLVGDAGRIRQILLNLASNAVKFTAAGEVAITVRMVPRDRGGTMVRFQVADTGIGITAEATTRLFESFSQADASTTRRYGGTGLGLAISRKLTAAMGGEIGVDSEVGAGSTFWFEVPLPAAVRADADVPLSHDLLTGLSVLVFDDNATNRLVLQSQLTAWGMRPDVVEHPRSVVALMRDAAAAGHPYAIAVLDMCMPEMDGLELARGISTDSILGGTRLIMLTSTMQLDVEELRQAGVAEWLTKPVRSSEFYDRLMRLMAPTTAIAASPAPAGVLRPVAAASLGRVLVVEDNALNQLVAEGVVSKLGYQVDIVANGAEALDAITATYSAVLMDCHMPVMDGFSATQQIRSRENGDRIPIIAMTAGAMAEDRDRCLAVGMDDYVSKPVNVNAVREALARWVRTPPATTPVQSRAPAGSGG